MFFQCFIFTVQRKKTDCFGDPNIFTMHMMCYLNFEFELFVFISFVCIFSFFFAIIIHFGVNNKLFV